MSRGHATRFWLVVMLCSVYSTWPVCIQSFDCFSPSSWTGCIRELCLAVLTGPNHTVAAAWNLKRKATRFLRTWDIDVFKIVCVATLDCYSSAPYQEMTALGLVVDALGPDVSVAAISGGSTVLVEAFCKYLASGYSQKLIDYPFFDLRLIGRSLQRTASSVFGSLEGLAMTEFIINRLKSSETRDWMFSRSALKKVILTNDLSMPHLVHVVAIIIGVWPLIVSYLKETGRKDDGDSLVARSPSFWSCWCTFRTRIYCTLWCFRRRELTSTSTLIRWLEWSSICCIFFLKSEVVPYVSALSFRGHLVVLEKFVGHF